MEPVDVGRRTQFEMLQHGALELLLGSVHHLKSAKLSPGGPKAGISSRRRPSTPEGGHSPRLAAFGPWWPPSEGRCHVQPPLSPSFSGTTPIFFRARLSVRGAMPSARACSSPSLAD